MNSSNESKGTLVYRERCRLLKECADAAEGGSKLIGVVGRRILELLGECELQVDGVRSRRESGSFSCSSAHGLHHLFRIPQPRSSTARRHLIDASQIFFCQ
jgi:hypothetical protein